MSDKLCSSPRCGVDGSGCAPGTGALNKHCHNNAALPFCEQQCEAPAPLLLLAQKGAAL